MVVFRTKSTCLIFPALSFLLDLTEGTSNFLPKKEQTSNDIEVAEKHVSHWDFYEEIYFPTSLRVAEAYEHISPNFSSGQKLTDTYLHLSINIFFFMYSQLLKSTVHDLKSEMWKNIASNIEIIHNITSLQTDNKDNSNVYIKSNICLFYEELLNYNLVYAEYLFRKKILIEMLKKVNSKFANYLQNDIELHKELATIDKETEHKLFINNSDSNCGQYANHHNVQIVNGFLTFILTANFTNKIQLTEYYNRLILKNAGKDFLNTDLATIQRYTEYLVTDNNIITMINEICKVFCNWKQTVTLFLLIEKFPINNLSIQAYIYLNELVKKHQYTMTYDVLILFSAIEIKNSHPDLNFVCPRLKDEFMKVRESFANYSETFIRKLADYISRMGNLNVADYTEIISLFTSYARSEVQSERHVWCLERIIESLYDIIPNKINEICSYIKFISRNSLKEMLASYKKLLDLLLSDKNNIYDKNIIMMAQHIKEERNEHYVLLENQLPSAIKHLIWNTECFIKNEKYNEYLFESKGYFVNTKEHNSRDHNCQAHTTNIFSLSQKGQWIFRYDKSENQFSIENLYGSYLIVREQILNNEKNFRLHFMPKSEEKSATKWELRPALCTKNSSYPFCFQLISNTDPPHYLFTENNKIDNFTRNVFTSQLKYNSTNSFWKLMCMDTNKENAKSTSESSPDEKSEHHGVSEKGIEYNRPTNNYFISFLEKLKFKIYAYSTGSLPTNLLLNETMADFIKKSSTFLHVHFIRLMKYPHLGLYNSNHTKNVFEIKNTKAIIFSAFLINKHLVTNQLRLNRIQRKGESGTCQDELTLFMKSMGYLDFLRCIGELHKINYDLLFSIFIRNTEANMLENLESFISNFVKTFQNSKTKVNEICFKKIISLKNNVSNYVLELNRIKKGLLFILISDALLLEKFQTAEIYFNLLGGEPMVLGIFDYLIDNFNFFPQKILHYFVVFIFHLYEMQKLPLEIVANVLDYSYKQLNSSTHLTDSLNDFYKYTAKLILYDIKDEAVWSESVTLKLERMVTYRYGQISKFAYIIMKQDINREKLKILTEQFFASCQYDNNNFIQLLNNMYKFRETKDYFRRITEFLDLLEHNLLEKGYNELIRIMLSNNKRNNTEVKNFYDYVYNNYGFIPCFHTGDCIDNIDTLLPNFTKKNIDDRMCVIWNSAFLYITKPYFTNNAKSSEGNSSLLVEIRDNDVDDWMFEYVKETGTFFMKSKGRNLYLSAGKHFGNSDNHKLLLTRKSQNYPIEWKVELQKNHCKHYQNNFFRLRATNLNKTFLYLSTDGSTSRPIAVILSKLKSPDKTDNMAVSSCNLTEYKEVWGIAC